MIRHYLLFFSLILCSVIAEAQIISTTKKVETDNSFRRRACADTNAGSVVVSLGNTSESGDLEFLCFDDELEIEHQGDQDLTGDPETSTSPGITYAVYTSMPTVTGPDLTSIEADPAALNPGNVVTVDNVSSNINGSGSFFNTGVLQSALNGGGPVELFFAPITVDNFDDVSLPGDTNHSWEGSPAGPCVNVRIDQAFRVVYLNEIQIATTTSGCSGTITATGGWPEFDQNQVYASFEIVNQADNTIRGTFTDVVDGNISNGETVNFTVPQPGVYDILFEDRKSCPGVTTVNMSSCDPGALSVEFDITHISNCGTSTELGNIVLMVNGGNAPYNISYVPPSPSLPGSAVITNAGGSTLVTATNTGNYVFTITDATNTTITETVTVFDIADFGTDVIIVEDVSCNGGMDGIAAVEVVYNGQNITQQDEFEFLWSNGETTDTIRNIGTGAHTVTITFNGRELCSPSSSTIPNPQAISYTPLVTPPSCPGASDGIFQLSISGGTVNTPDDYQVNWFLLPDNDGVSSGATYDGVGAGENGSEYAFEIRDLNGCLVRDTLEMVNPDTIDVVFSNINPVSCVTESDGSATVQASGGSPFALGNIFAYHFEWSSGETTGPPTGVPRDIFSANGLTAGVNFITVTDSRGCSVIDSVFIDAPPPVAIDSTFFTSPSCFGDSDGTAFVRATGGNGTYTYNWSNGSSGDVQTDLAAGNYIVTATDGLGCSSGPTTVNIPETPELILSASSVTPSSCNGTDNGVIQLAPIGGGEVYNYEWSHDVSNTNSIALDLSPGTYTATVTDQNGCQDTTMAVITEPNPITAVVAPIEPINCFGESTFIEIDTAYGGNGGQFQFSIDGFNFFDVGSAYPIPGNLDDLVVLDGTLYVRDGTGECVYEEPIFLDQPEPVVVDFDITNADPFVTIENQPEINFDTDPLEVEIELGDSINIVVLDDGVLLGIDSLTWTTSPQVATPLCPTNDCIEAQLFTTDDVMITVDVTDTNGCRGTGKINLEIDNNRNVYIPNVFNPNSSNPENNLFKVFTGQGVVRVKTMQVFDRWGALVYSAADFVPVAFSDIGWDGTFRGKRSNPGVYVYLVEVEFLDGVSLLYRGDVTLAY